jgi:hypothetical protein
MKKMFFIAALMMCFFVTSFAQDFLVKNNGDTIFCKIKKVTETEISYSLKGYKKVILIDSLISYSAAKIDNKYENYSANEFIGTSKTVDSLQGKYTYCELLGIQKRILSTKIAIKVDYGDGIPKFIVNESTGKLEMFNSMAGALNFMAKFGWEFQQAYVVTTGSQDVYRWLLKRQNY